MNHASWITGLIDGLVVFGSNYLLPSVILLFFTAATARILIYYTVKRESWFVQEFEKRMLRAIDFSKVNKPLSFYVVLKRLLEKTFYEVFEQRSVMKREYIDHILTPGDRIFLVQQGCAYLVRDTLKRTALLKKDDNGFKELEEVSRGVLQNNVCFSKLFGIFSVSTLNSFISQLAGLFVVFGIFGTFLGIMRALPELSGMDINDAVGSKAVMEGFLAEVAFSMSASVIGILCSVLLQTINAFFNPEDVFMNVVDKYHDALIYLWRRCDTNEVPNGLPSFDEHKDPMDALAELSLQKELAAADQKFAKRNPELAQTQGQGMDPDYKKSA